jgi:hypothetical protein
MIIKDIDYLKEALLLNKWLSNRYVNKSIYNSIIPLNIYQTWHTKKLPPNMMKSSVFIKKNNPAFNYYLFDDNDCRRFIKNNFSQEVLNAYDSLIPGAYKADLWRYCVLYKNGGIYLDIKYIFVNNFKFINLTEKEHLVMDLGNNAIYNAFMVCLPGNDLLLRAINKVIENVNNKYYGDNILEPTGPTMLYKIITNNEKSDMIDMKHEYHTKLGNKYILFNNILILQSYNNFSNEYHNNKKTQHYSVYWKNRTVYR